MTTIIGIDFSGAQNEAKSHTWIAQARLDPAGFLRFNSVQPACRDDIYDLLMAVQPPATIAMDFPFGVPAAFAKFLKPGGTRSDMRDAWRSIAGRDADRFTRQRNQFVAVHGVLQRSGDAKYHPYPESYSPLQKAPSNMLPMTYEGICLLKRLYGNYPRRWHVPPMTPTSPPDETVTLLELMPGAFLKAIGLRSKGYKTGPKALERRNNILNDLPNSSGVPLPNLHIVRMACRANDDCLDAVVASVGAAAWARDPSRFHHPNRDELPDAALEGWIYVPRRGGFDGSA